MNGHTYRQSPATHRVKTEYGTFHLCPACVIAGHAGCHRPSNALSHMSTAEPSRQCDCEHVDHFDDEQAAQTCDLRGVAL